jgi:hypothetical protein
MAAGHMLSQPVRCQLLLVRCGRRCAPQRHLAGWAGAGQRGPGLCPSPPHHPAQPANPELLGQAQEMYLLLHIIVTAYEANLAEGRAAQQQVGAPPPPSTCAPLHRPQRLQCSCARPRRRPEPGLGHS